VAHSISAAAPENSWGKKQAIFITNFPFIGTEAIQTH
jgi:hypothetical protein